MSEVQRIANTIACNIPDMTKRYHVTSSLGSGATCYEQVEAFHVLYDAPVEKTPVEGFPSMDDARVQMRLDLIEEEFEELKVAANGRDLIEVADALGDLIYVVTGFAIEAGIDLQAVVAEIHASNMTKLDSDGSVIRREDGKILKGPNYRRPDIRTALFGLGVVV